MSVDPTHLTSAYDNVDRSTYTTASISPTANRWLVIDVVNRQAAATVPTPTITGLSGGSTLTWSTEIAWPYSNNLRRVSRFYAWTGSSPGTGTISIALGATATGCAWIVYEMGADVDTSDPFVDTVPTEVSANNIAFNFGGYDSADNRPLVAVWHAANQASTPEAGYTEIGDVNGNSPDGGFAAAFHPTVADTTPTYSWASNVNALGIASEIKAGGGGAVDLVIQDASHAHSVENQSLTQVHNLAVQDASHGHAADALALAQAHNLTVANALHSHSADNVVLEPAVELVIASATHAHTANNVELAQVHELEIQNATHAHSADNLLVTLPAIELVISDGAHAHNSNGLVLTQTHYLAIQDAHHELADNYPFLADQKRAGRHGGVRMARRQNRRYDRGRDDGR